MGFVQYGHVLFTHILTFPREFLVFLAGACEMANDLSSEDSLKKKLQQVFKEAFAMWHKNGADCHNFPYNS